MGERAGLSAAIIVFAGVGASVTRRRPVVASIGLALLAVGAGSLNVQLRPDRDPLEVLARDVPRCAMQIRVLEDAGGLGTLLSIDQATCGPTTLRAAGTAVSPDPIGDAGMQLEGIGWVVPLSDDPFDVARRRAGADVLVQLQHHEELAPPQGLHALAARVRSGLVEATGSLSPRSGALLRGLAIGDTDGIDQGTIDRFRASGLSHILAVSGSNVAIVLAAVALSLKRVGHRVRIAGAYIALGLFILIVGPDASVLRAGVMGAISLGCLAWGRRSEPLVALAWAVVVLVSLRPGMLFSAGLHLSVAATAGIILFSAAISRRLGMLPVPARLMLSATLGAQIAVAPLLILTFGELSLSAPLANLLALPAVAPATVVGIAAGVVAVLSETLAGWLTACVAPALWWVLLVGDRLGTPGWASARIPAAVGWVGLVVVVAAAVRTLRAPIAPLGKVSA